MNSSISLNSINISNVLMNIFYEYSLNAKTILLLTINFSMSIEFNDSKYCYVSQKNRLNISHLFTRSLM